MICTLKQYWIVFTSISIVATIAFNIYFLWSPSADIAVHSQSGCPSASNLGISISDQHMKIEDVAYGEEGIFIKPQSRFIKYYYFEPLKNDLGLGDIFKFFEDCPIAEWSQNSLEHYFIDQLQYNRNGNRVWDCSRAQIVVIPITLGNWYSDRCGLGPDWESRLSDDELIERINRRIFEDDCSCWNIEPRTRPFHFLLIGGSNGRTLIRLMNEPVPFEQFTSWWDRLRFSLIPIDWRPPMRAQMWFHHKFIFADSYSDSWIKSEGESIVTVSHGFTSMASESVWTTKRIMDEVTVPLKGSGIALDFSGSKSGPNELPEITIRHNFEEWKQRKFTVFLMGPAGDREASSMRGMALKHIPPKNNVLIQTESDSVNFNFHHCNEGNDGFIESYPCSMTPSKGSYLRYLTQSRFNVVIRGDDPCSPQFYDGLAFNAINIVINDQFDGCLIGRSLMTEQQRKLLYLTVSEKEFKKNPAMSIYIEMSRYDISHFERMLKEIEKWKPYLLWDSYRSETAETVLLEAFNKRKANPLSFTDSLQTDDDDNV